MTGKVIVIFPGFPGAVRTLQKLLPAAVNAGPK